MPEESPVPERMQGLVVIPTYNEVKTIQAIVEAVLEQDARLSVLVVDDASPDGTGDLIERLAASHSRVSLLRRAGKEGYGTACVAGFRWALGRSYDAILQMDADGSHDPRYLPSLFAGLEWADMVIGSRYVAGGGISDWSLLRQAISRGGNFMARRASGLCIRDCTSGFRAYRRAVLEAIPLASLGLQGYAFQVAAAYEVARRGFRIREEPIIFTDRNHGKSKMSLSIMVEAARYLGRLYQTSRSVRDANLDTTVSR